MARAKNLIVECDVCGFEYKRPSMKLNSYGMLVCPEDYEGHYDLKNHPQNRSPVLRETNFIRDVRPENNNDRNVLWENASTNWEDTNNYWNTI